MQGVKVKESKIHGLGLFSNQVFNEGDIIGIAHVNNIPSGTIGKYHNHSDKPNSHSVSIGNKRYIAALRSLRKGEEITVDYRRQPELEQPEDFKKQNGGSITQEEIDAANTAMMKARLAYAYMHGNPAAQRMVVAPDQPYDFGDGNTGTHYMASMDNYAVPQIQDENGQLMLGDYGPGSAEAIRFDSDEDANYFAENYKQVTPDLSYRQEEFAEGGIAKYPDGGQPCPDGYVFYNGQCIEWQEPTINDTNENTGYNAALGEINQDKRLGSIENNNWWTEHEKFHHLQNLAGGMSTSGALGQRPNYTTASDESMSGYYNRRDSDLNEHINSMIQVNPELQFIPRKKLLQSQFPIEGEQPSFLGAEDSIYQDPSTVEGEARVYENDIRGGMPSMFGEFPKHKYGGLHRFVKGGEPETEIVSEILIPNSNNTISSAPTFKSAFKIARNIYGPNYIFDWQGRKYGTNLAGEDFKPSEEVLTKAGLNVPSVKENLNEQNTDLNNPYISKSTVKLEPDSYKSWDKIKQKNLELNVSV